MKVKLIEHTNEPLVVMASAAAVTRGLTVEEFLNKYSREEAKRLLRDCYEQGHWAVFEFSDWDFEVEGASRVFEGQANRSRHMSPMWESGRHDQEYKAALVMKDNKDVSFGIDYNSKMYKDLVQLAGVEPEDARYALPQGVARKGRLKRNFRNLMETSMIRLCSHAQKEYRDAMWKMKEIVTEIDPFLGELLQPKCQVQLFCNEKECCGYNGAIPKAKVKELIAAYKQ